MISPRYKTTLLYGPWQNPVRVHRNQHMCGAMWDMEDSLMMVSLDIWKINPKLNRDLNGAKMYFLSRFRLSLLQFVGTYHADKLKTSSKWCSYWLLSSIWPWRSKSMHWTKFGDTSFNGCQYIGNILAIDGHTHPYTHKQAQVTTMPEGQNWPLVKMLIV